MREFSQILDLTASCRNAAGGLKGSANDGSFPIRHSYARLPDRFFARLPPTPVSAPKLIKLNRQLASDLGLDAAWLPSPEAFRFSPVTGRRRVPSRPPWLTPDISSALSCHNSVTGADPARGSGRKGRPPSRHPAEGIGANPVLSERRWPSRAWTRAAGVCGQRSHGGARHPDHARAGRRADRGARHPGDAPARRRSDPGRCKSHPDRHVPVLRCAGRCGWCTHARRSRLSPALPRSASNGRNPTALSWRA